MGDFKIKKFQISPYLAAISAAAAILAGVWVLDRSEQQRFWEYNRANTLNQLSTVRSQLEGSLNSRMFLMRGLVAYISNNPNISEGEFAAMGKIVLSKQNGIRTINLVKGTTIAYVYPRQGNEKAIGVDLMGIPEQRQMVEEAIETRQTVLAGPIKLLQGGTGFISRTPIFLTPAGETPETGVYWGLTGVIIDRDALLDEAGLINSSSKLQYALRGKDAKGVSGEVFFGDESIFQQNPVLLEVTLPNGSWQLAAIPAGGWPENSPSRGWLLCGGGLLALLISAVAFSLVYGPAKLRESEAKYRQLVENANSIIVQLDSQGNITFFNEFAETFFGYSEAEIMGTSAIGTVVSDSHMSENDAAIMMRELLKYPEKYFTNENKNIRRNGERVWISWRNQPLLDAGGRLTGLLCVGTDITDRKLAEAALQESESRYRAIIEDQTELIYRFLPSGILTFVNDACCRYFNKSRSELLGNSLMPLILEEDRKYFRHIFNSLSLENPAVTWEQRVILKTGDIRWIQWTDRAIFDSKGVAIECQAVGRDISDRKQAEIALQTSEAELRALFAAMNDIIFVMDTEGRYLKIAPTNPELLYKPPAEIVGKTLHEILPPEKANFFLKQIQLTARTKQRYSLEYNLQIGSQEMWFVATISPMQENTVILIARDITARKHTDNWLNGQRQILEAIAKNIPISDTLTALIKIIEQQSTDVKASILLLDKDGKHLRHAVAPSLPESYTAAVNRVEIGPNVGSCGAAVYRCQPVIVTDIATDPLWKDFRDLALSFGLRACWSHPILSSQGEVVGTFAMYYDQPKSPQDFDLQLIESAKNLAGIAIESKQREESLKQLNQELEIRVEERTALLKQTEERWQLALKGNNDGIWDWNLQTKQLFVSDRFKEITGYKDSDITNYLTTWNKNLHPDDLAIARKKFQEHLERKTPHYIHEYRLWCNNSDYKWILSRGQALWDEEGKPVRIVGSITDINEPKQAEAALRQSEARERERAEQLEKALLELHAAQAQLVQTEKMSSLGQLVAGIAHEINNPVNFIHANISYLKEYTKQLLDLVALYEQEYPDRTSKIIDLVEEIDLDFLTEDLKKIVGSMQVGSERIRQIVLSLRNFSRLDEAEMKPVDIHAGIESTLLILQHRLKSRDSHPGIEVIKEFGKLPLVECYASQMNQVFMNVIANAIDAIEERYQKLSMKELWETPGRIVIGTRASGEQMVEIEISDNGTGIPKEAIARIFNPFFTTKVVGKGTGLGMSISHSIVVEKHKGKLDCTSEIGKGTSFKIQIPIAKLDRQVRSYPVDRAQ